MVTVLDQQIADAVIDGDVDVVEELRLEDYELGRDAGRWWPGGMLQVKASSNSSFENVATTLGALRLGLPSDSDEETVIDEVYTPLYAQHPPPAPPGSPFLDT